MNILAPQLEYIRARQKDSEILTYITNSAISCFREFFGNVYTPEISLGVEVFYLASSLLVQEIKQTPGQEHTSSAFVDFSKVRLFRRVLVSKNYLIAAKRFAPGIAKTVAYIFFRSVFPYLFKKLFEIINKNCPDSIFSNSFPGAEEIIQEVSNLNFAIFLLTGYFDEISKRLLGIVYTKLQRSRNQPVTLKRLGYLVLVQSFFSLYKIFLKIFIEIKKKETQEPTVDRIETEEHECVLCLSTLKSPTATPCGHIFCWDCIMSAVNVNSACPNCRQPFTPQSLLALRNF